MDTLRTARVSAFSLCFVTSLAAAEWRCDCTTIVDSCSASVAVQDSWVEISSDKLQCARVDYFIDGVPFVALVVDGTQRQDWLARNAEPNILIQSCQVCMDNSNAAPADAPRVVRDTELAPVIEVAPVYPEGAAARGLEGYAEVRFTVTPLGEIQDPAIVSSEPAGVFELSALAAIARWRYQPDQSREPTILNHRFAFNRDRELLRLAPSPAQSATSVTSTQQRNQCVREQASYNYGEMIEVGLLNACADPIVVYSCAEGTGQYQRRWVCVSSEARAQVLVQPGDPREGTPGSVALPDGRIDFQYTSDMYVARAPNSQYWWLACNMDDAECRVGGRQWVRSIDRQVASIDPQDRTRRQLARAN
jgi:TonB family protein